MNLSQLDWKIGILGVLAIAGGGLAIKELLRHKRSQKNHLVLLGDVGGTNIRLQLVTMNEEQEQPEQVIKWETFLVERYASLRAAIKDFLVVDGKTITPCVAVVAVAGPVADNKVIVMANVMKWGTLSGEELGRELRIEHFKLINDF